MSNRTVLDEIAEALEQATPGPWSHAWNGDSYDYESGLGISAFMGGGIAEMGPRIRPDNEILANANLIELCVNYAPALLAVARAAAELELWGKGHDCDYYRSGTGPCAFCQLREALRSLDPRLVGEKD